MIQNVRHRGANAALKPDETPAAMVPVHDPLSMAIRAAMRAELEPIVNQLLEVISARPLPRLLDTGEIAAHLSVTTATVRNLRAQGLPTIMVGSSPRFDVAAVTAWLSSKGQQP